MSSATATRTHGPARAEGHAHDARAHAAPGAAVHLTRRGRALLLVALVAMLYAAFAVGRANTEAAVTVEAAPALVQTTVQRGDTLWAVARRIAPDRDPRPVVEQLRRLNDLPTAGLQVGQQLLLPAAA